MRTFFRTPNLNRLLIAWLFILSFCQSTVVVASPFFLQFPFENALASHTIKSMEYLEENGVWLLDTGGSVSFYDGTKTQPLSLFIPTLPSVSDIGVINGELLLLIDEKLHKYNLISGQIEFLFFTGEMNITDMEVLDAALYTATASGVYRIDLENNKVEKVSAVRVTSLYRSESSLLGSNGREIIDVFSNTTLHVFAQDMLIFDVKYWERTLFVGSADALRVIRRGQVIGSYFANDTVFVIEKSEEGIWVGTNRGLFHSSNPMGKLSFTHMNQTPLDTFSFLGQQVTSIAKGKNGDVWIASDKGLNFRSSILAGIHRLPVGYLNGEMAEQGISSFIDWENNFFLSSRNKLVKLDDQLRPLISKSFNFSIQSMESLNNTLWVASASGLHAYRADTLESLDNELPQLLRNIPIDRLLKDRHSIWISSDTRILRYWPESHTLVDFDTTWSESGDALLPPM
ncbi:hypothetical protein AT251_10875 [Enterovibrio nigricans]|nr:hypothetical protein AT251_10875 [Enterovibrio nigricans]